MAGDDPFGEWKYYQYNPSMAAAIIFVVLFGAISGLHLYQMVRTKVWIFIPFVLGGFCKFDFFSWRSCEFYVNRELHRRIKVLTGP